MANNITQYHLDMVFSTRAVHNQVYKKYSFIRHSYNRERCDYWPIPEFQAGPIHDDHDLLISYADAEEKRIGANATHNI